MALIQCPECKNEISDTAKLCPRCGFVIPQQTNGSKGKVAFIIFAVLDFLLALFILLTLGAVPQFADTFANLGGRLPWLTDFVCHLGYLFKPYVMILVIALGGFALFFSFNSKFRKRVETKNLIVAFFLLLFIFILFRISMYLPTWLGTFKDLGIQ